MCSSDLYYDNLTIANYVPAITPVEDKYLEVIVTELDGDTSTPELLYSNGEVDQINFSGGAKTDLSDWESTFNKDRKSVV